MRTLSPAMVYPFRLQRGDVIFVAHCHCNRWACMVSYALAVTIDTIRTVEDRAAVDWSALSPEGHAVSGVTTFGFGDRVPRLSHTRTGGMLR